MSGPRVTSGVDSKQDYATPGDFMAAVEKRFGMIEFDLAAHAGNAKHKRYFAPGQDQMCFAVDAFKHDWAPLTKQFGGVLWLNCEFSDVKPWAAKCASAGELGANVTLLTPASVGSNWFRDHVAGRADVYLLSGRLCFDGKNVFPKDCMLSHYYPACSGSMAIWDWRADVISQRWARELPEAYHRGRAQGSLP